MLVSDLREILSQMDGRDDVEVIGQDKRGLSNVETYEIIGLNWPEPFERKLSDGSSYLVWQLAYRDYRADRN